MSFGQMVQAGSYYVPSAHPYQRTLPGGIEVQEAYPGQYYTLSGLGQAEERFADRVNLPVMAWATLSTASMAACAYHGFKRNNSVGWAIGWALMGAMFPVIAPTIGVAQGFGKRKAGR